MRSKGRGLQTTTPAPSLSLAAWDPFRAGASPRNLRLGHTGSHCGLAIEPDNLHGSIKLTMSQREIMTS
jgi:hypothetical protein